jgi:hypothetical protein
MESNDTFLLFVVKIVESNSSSSDETIEAIVKIEKARDYRLLMQR